MTRVSVIVPVGPNDPKWVEFFREIEKLPLDWEIIFTGARRLSAEEQTLFDQLKKNRLNCSWLYAGIARRGIQLNKGARAARGKVLWFLHVDSRFDEAVCSRISQLANQEISDGLYYFRLGFYGQDTRMRLNQWGANVRSLLLKMPFGDQGFVMTKMFFWGMGGFREDVKIGEDHHFVWKVRRKGYPLFPLKESLMTSSRRYEEKGWVATTLRYNMLTYKQALPEIWQWLRPRKDYD